MSKCDYTINCWADPDCKNINCPGHPKYQRRELPVQFAGPEPRGTLKFCVGIVCAALLVGVAIFIF